MSFRIESCYTTTQLLILLQRLGSGAYAAYCPWGPEIAVPVDLHGVFLEELSEHIRPMLPPKTVYIRYDLPWPSPYESPQDEPSVGAKEIRMNIGTEQWRLRKAPTDVQPPANRLCEMSATVHEYAPGAYVFLSRDLFRVSRRIFMQPACFGSACPRRLCEVL